MTQALSRRNSALLPAFSLAIMIALATVVPSAHADSSVAGAAAPDTPVMAISEQEAEEKFAPQPIQVGDATEGLMAWQRSGQIASPTPRPIPGVIAYRSYERYLKSFEHPIPEYLNSSVKKTSSGNDH